MSKNANLILGNTLKKLRSINTQVVTPLIPSIFIGQTINDSINVEQNSVRNKSMHKQQGVRLKFIGRYFYKKNVLLMLSKLI